MIYLIAVKLETSQNYGKKKKKEEEAYSIHLFYRPVVPTGSGNNFAIWSN